MLFFLKLGQRSAVPDRRELATRSEQPFAATAQLQDGARGGSGQVALLAEQALHEQPGICYTPLL